MSKPTYQELQAQARELDIPSHGVKAPELAELIREALHDGSHQMPPKARRTPIERTNALGHWWCPLCDNSQTGLVSECRGCGAVRDGDEVIAP